MKKVLTILLLLLTMGAGSLSAQADPPELKLRKGSQFEGFDYTYISPWMLQNMQPGELQKLVGLPPDHISHIEILKTRYHGQDANFKSLINKLSSEPNFTLVGYNRENNTSGVKICVDQSGEKSAYGVSSSSTDLIHRILIITWNDYGRQHTVIYIVGEFTPDEVKGILHF